MSQNHFETFCKVSDNYDKGHLTAQLQNVISRSETAKNVDN